MRVAALLLVLIASLVARPTVDAAPPHIILDPREDIAFGPLENAPNGHISFLKGQGVYRIWVPGRLKTSPTTHEEGGFLFHVVNWSPDHLAQEHPLFTLGHKVDETMPDCGPYIFDRNYAALNAVVPAAAADTLLAFYDAEYHVACPNGEPLLSSIGIARSTDGGVTWQDRQQIIQGLDEAKKTTAFVTEKQLNEFNNGHILDTGASGPSVVTREDDGAVYLYLYYADRTPITGGDDSIYVARAPLASGGMPGNWQKWTGAGWGTVGDQKMAAPIVVPSAAAGAALQPHVSWNTALHSWLMVFKTSIDFEVTTSADGLHWDQPVTLLPFAETDSRTAFPTLISPDACNGDGQGCEDDSDSYARPTPSQQVTGASGWLYYSSLPMGERHYIGHRAPFRIVAE
jgi:hypothetical protein